MSASTRTPGARDLAATYREPDLFLAKERQFRELGDCQGLPQIEGREKGFACHRVRALPHGPKVPGFQRNSRPYGGEVIAKQNFRCFEREK